MAKKLLIAFAAMMVLSIIALAATKPDFSGTWTMDRARSFGMPGDMMQVLTITHKDDTLEVETKITQPNNERTGKDTIVVDGKEHEFQPPAPPGGELPPNGSRTASWLRGETGIPVPDIPASTT